MRKKDSCPLANNNRVRPSYQTPVIRSHPLLEESETIEMLTFVLQSTRT